MTQGRNNHSTDHVAAASATRSAVRDIAIKGLALRLISFAGAVVSTVGLLTFFWFDGLAPYRWWMIIGGALVSGLFGWWGDKYNNQLRAIKAMGPEELIKQVVTDSDKEMDGQDNASR